jgi:anti-sigma factor RsiW
MKPDTQGSSQWATERVEAYLDDLLSAEERGRFEEELERSFMLREELEAAQRQHAQIRALPMRRCPDKVTELVLSRIQKRPSAPVRRWPWAVLPGWGFPHSSLAALGAACVLLLILVIQPWRSAEPVSPAPTQREVRAAERQIVVTLAYLARVGAKTGAAVQAEVYRSAVVAPIKETVRAISQTDLASTIKSVGNKES